MDKDVKELIKDSADTVLNAEYCADGAVSDEVFAE